MDGVRNFTAMNISATGLTAQRLRMDVLAENIANASTTRTDEGGAYQRKVVTLRSLDGRRPVAFSDALSQAMGLVRTSREHLGPGQPLPPDGREPGVEVASITRDESEGPLVYDPTHPDADEQGYVQMPNVEIVRELLALTGAARLYEANLAALRASRDAAQDTLRIGRG